MLYSINKRNIGLKKLGAILLAVMFLITTMAPAAVPPTRNGVTSAIVVRARPNTSPSERPLARLVAR